jgi:hypothetical protein
LEHGLAKHRRDHRGPRRSARRPGTNDQRSTYGNLGAGSIRYDLREAWRNGTKDTFTNAIDSEWRRRRLATQRRRHGLSRETPFRDTDHGFFGSNTLNGSTLPLTGIGTGTASKQLITLNLLDTGPQVQLTHHPHLRLHADGQHGRRAGDQLAGSGHHDHRRRSFPPRRNQRNRSLRCACAPNAPSASRAIRSPSASATTTMNSSATFSATTPCCGPSSVPTTSLGPADDNTSQIAAVNVLPARDTYYDFPAVTRVSMRRLYGLYQQHPDWFQYRDAESYRFSTTEPYEVN